MMAWAQQVMAVSFRMLLLTLADQPASPDPNVTLSNSSIYTWTDVCV